MPRSSTRTHMSSAVLATPGHTSLAPNVIELRKQWKWAAFSQFFFSFAPLFALSDVTIQDIENDLAHSSSIVLPRIMQRMLYALTLDRKISLSNWQTALRRQYHRRDPEANPIGVELPPAFVEPAPTDIILDTQTPEASAEREADMSQPDLAIPSTSITDTTSSPITGDGKMEDCRQTSNDELLPRDQTNDTQQIKNWNDLSMLVKLDSMYLLTEWQFQNPMRLRSLMKDDDETAQWRINPIGRDRGGNSYWLIGGDRLWIQRPPPKGHSKAAQKLANGFSKQEKTRQRRPAPSVSNKKLGKSTASPHKGGLTKSAESGVSREGRTTRAQGGFKADTQGSLQSGTILGKRDKSGQKQTRPPVGIRVSARLRANAVDEGWQPVPDEWLAGSRDVDGDTDNKKGGRRRISTGLESDDEFASDLTELSSDDQDKPDANGESSLSAHPVELEPPSDYAAPIDYSEWETVCVSLPEWEHMQEQFKNTTHPAEKALHNVLSRDVIPVVTAELLASERKHRLEEAVVCRKRSSRIAVKESEKEAARLIAKQNAELEEKLSRARRLEARQQKEEADRKRRELAREQRRRERQEKTHETQSHDVASGSTPAMISVDSAATQSMAPLYNTPIRPPAGDGLEWDRENSHGLGMNQGSSGSSMMCCRMCLKWRHVPHHDQANLLGHHAQQSWVDVEEFVCDACLLGHSTTEFDPRQLNQNLHHGASFHQYTIPMANHPTAIPAHSRLSETSSSHNYYDPQVQYMV